MRLPEEDGFLTRWDLWGGCNPHHVCAVCKWYNGKGCTNPDHPKDYLSNPQDYLCNEITIPEYLEPHLQASPYKTLEDQEAIRKRIREEIDITLIGPEHPKKLTRSHRIDNIDLNSIEILKTRLCLIGEEIQIVFDYPNNREIKAPKNSLSYPLKEIDRILFYQNGIRKTMQYGEFEQFFQTGELKNQLIGM